MFLGSEISSRSPYHRLRRLIHLNIHTTIYFEVLDRWRSLGLYRIVELHETFQLRNLHRSRFLWLWEYRLILLLRCEKGRRFECICRDHRAYWGILRPNLKALCYFLQSLHKWVLVSFLVFHLLIIFQYLIRNPLPFQYIFGQPLMIWLPQCSDDFWLRLLQDLIDAILFFLFYFIKLEEHGSGDFRFSEALGISCTKEF